LRKPVERAPPKRKARRAGDGSRTAKVGSTEPGNEIVFQALREWRREVAKEHGVPAYTVFHDSTLQEVSRVLPQSLDELRTISGIGATKLDRYGATLLEVVRGSGTTGGPQPG
jgi:ATP-dependent DNA helicase RecQ